MENIGSKSEPKFSEPTFKPFGMKSKNLSAPTLVDIDNDGDLDLFGIKAKSGGGQIYFMENIGSKSEPKFSEPIFKPFGIKSKDLSAPTLVDIDNDGDLDLFGIKAKSGGGQIYFMENE